MAKKKVTHRNQTVQIQEEKTHQLAAMEVPSEKLESLKALNSMLLKETVERRQQVDSLLQSQGSLQSELTRSKSENEVLLAELSRLSERTVQLELERSLVFVFVAVQVAQQAEEIERGRDGFGREKTRLEERLDCLEGEMQQVLVEKSEIEKMLGEKESEIQTLNKKLNELLLCIGNERDVSQSIGHERDEMKAKFDVQIEETNELAIKLIETERREKEIQEEVWKLKNEYNIIMVEKEDKEKGIQAISRDKDLIEKSLAESDKVIEALKRKIEEITKEKEVVDELRKVELRNRTELENNVNVLNGMVSRLQKEEERLRINAGDLEKRCFEGVEKEKQMVMKIDALVEEKNENEKRFESLTEEKSSIMKDLDEALNQMDKLKRKMEVVTKEKIEVEEVKVKRDGEIVDLQKTIATLSDDVLSVEETCRVQIEKIKQLEFEASQCRGAIDKVTVDRDEANKVLNEEKQNGISLREKIVEMENRIEETNKIMEELKVVNLNLVGEKRELESCCAMLKKEIASLESTLLEAEKEFDNAQSMVKSVNAKSELLLTMLNNTAASVCVSKDESGVLNDDHVFDDEQMAREEIEPFVAALEAIKKAVKGKESKVEDMRRQLESLQNSAAEAHKKKSFWTVVSSATTILAAASIAYVARGH